MNSTETEKIKRFMNDKAMSSIVLEFLQEVVGRPCKDRDVHILAARFLAIELLTQAWKEMGRYAENEKIEGMTKNVGM